MSGGQYAAVIIIMTSPLFSLIIPDAILFEDVGTAWGTGLWMLIRFWEEVWGCRYRLGYRFVDVDTVLGRGLGMSILLGVQVCGYR